MNEVSIMAQFAAQRRREQPDRPLVGCLSSIARSMRQLLSIRLAGIGVMVGQDQLLDLLRTDMAASVTRIAEAACVRPSTVSKMLDQFVDKGWAVRELDAGDKRRINARLTALGAHVQAMVREVWDALEGELAKELGAAGETSAATLAQLRILDGVVTQRLARLR